MLDPNQLRLRVIRPALVKLAALMADPIPYSLAAENLLLGTALVESVIHKIGGGIQYLVQIPAGPARGIFQIEPNTHADVWLNYLTTARRSLRGGIFAMASEALMPVPGDPHRSMPPHEELEYNLLYATAIARLVYRRSPALLPLANDAPALAALHKRVYNTAAGKTIVQQSEARFREVVAGGKYGPS